ncbi:MAG TPA: hypothetical protein VKN14_09935 [Flavobacteriaceae bacterium]|nr:hypothetical protein [Flavobacteriaceae bacterium]
MDIPDNIPETELQLLTEKLNTIVDGDSDSIEVLVSDVFRVIDQSREGLITTTQGGVTQFKSHWYGWNLSLSHEFIQDYKDIPELIAGITALFPAAAPIAVAVLVDLVVISIMDHGNGVYWQSALWVGPILGPLPQ